MSKRNTKGNGSVRQRENGTWEARCTINGKRKSFYGEKQSDVLKAMRAALKDSDDGVYFEPQRMTVGSWLDIWLEEYVAPSVKPLTYSAYKSSIETHIKPAIGKIKLQSLNAGQVQAFYNNLLNEKKKSPKTIRNVHGILHEAIKQAIKLRFLGLNVTDACTLPRAAKKELNPFTEEQLYEFLKNIQEDEPLKDLFTAALFTGMREGEICGLSWDAVNFRENKITIKQQLCKEKKKSAKYYIATTKNGKERTLTVAPFVMDIFRRIQAAQYKDHITLGTLWQNEWNLVFTKPDGSHLIPQTVYKRFKAQAAKVGRPDARFHDARHTYAVTSLQEGDDVKTLQQNLGHATASFTLDVYGHVSEKMKKESANRMQAYYEKMKA